MQKRMSLVALLYTSFFFYLFFFFFFLLCTQPTPFCSFLFSRTFQFQGRTGSSPLFSFIFFFIFFCCCVFSAFCFSFGVQQICRRS
ncbi:hypothetical protein EDD21DRAFT_52951 [Dissophora ornata]|nr:hypothetical protein EDD21DRAFT_52951 [Dissophora ornata]